MLQPKNVLNYKERKMFRSRIWPDYVRTKSLPDIIRPYGVNRRPFLG
jgi:hypothetical protein